MGWQIGYDEKWHRDVGYGVPAVCDKPRCDTSIDRGLSYVCGGEPFGGEHGCGLYFCAEHLFHRKPKGAENVVQLCPRCYAYEKPYQPKADVREWVEFKLADESWSDWRAANPVEVERMRASLAA
jgi:hypothetical protein